MKLQWISAVLLGSAMAVGCGDRNNQNAQDLNANTGTPAATAPADTDQSALNNREAVSPDRDTAAVRPDSDGARPTTGTRAGRTTRDTDRREAPRTVERQTPREWNNASPSSVESAPRPRAAAVPEVRELTVPAGTSLSLELMTPLSSETARVETPVRARLRNAVTVDGFTAIPAGTVFNGTVTDVEEAGRVKGRARVAFRFDEAQVSGVRERLRTNALSFEGEATKGEDATKIGAGAGIGAAIGGIIGGGKGAAKGAAIGGAAGTGAVLATRGKDVTLAEGAHLNTALADSVTVRAPAR